MIAVDTNILVYAHREDAPEHAKALSALSELAEGQVAWALPVFVLAEFLRVVTHPNMTWPTKAPEAIAKLDRLLDSPSLQLLFPGNRYWAILKEVALEAAVKGNLFIDAQIVAVCLEYGATTILTEDRDFRRFSGITVQRLPSKI
ncbi:MAG: TA system VapC family ribonuclease toxin [Actinomycetota bacterium]